MKIFYGCGRKEHVWASSLEQNEDWKKKASNIEHWFVWDEIYLPISGSGGLVCFICNCGEYRVNQYPTNQGWSPDSKNSRLGKGKSSKCGAIGHHCMYLGRDWGERMKPPTQKMKTNLNEKRKQLNS